MKKITILSLMIMSSFCFSEDALINFPKSLREHQVSEENITKIVQIVKELTPEMQQEAITELEQPFIGPYYIVHFLNSYEQNKGSKDQKACTALLHTQQALLYSIWVSYSTPPSTPKPITNPILDWNHSTIRKKGNQLNP